MESKVTAACTPAPASTEATCRVFDPQVLPRAWVAGIFAKLFFPSLQDAAFGATTSATAGRGPPYRRCVHRSSHSCACQRGTQPLRCPGRSTVVLCKCGAENLLLSCMILSLLLLQSGPGRRETRENCQLSPGSLCHDATEVKMHSSRPSFPKMTMAGQPVQRLCGCSVSWPQRGQDGAAVLRLLLRALDLQQAVREQKIRLQVPNQKGSSPLLVHDALVLLRKAARLGNALRSSRSLAVSSLTSPVGSEPRSAI